MSILENSRKLNLPTTIITTTRVNEWNMSCDRLNEYVNKDYQLRYLSEREIRNLIILLEKHDELGPNLRDKNTEEKVKELEEKAGRQLLVALHEATSGKPFREIIVDEYEHIYPKQAQDLYLTVCFLNRLGAPVRAGLIARVHGVDFDEFNKNLFQPLEHVVQADIKHSHDVYYLARHPQIAQIIFDEILSEKVERYNEYIRVLRYLNVAYDSDRDSFRKLVKAKTLKNIFIYPEDVKAIYNIAQEFVGEDAYLYQQMANYERSIPDGDYSLADTLLKSAKELNPRDDTIVHSQAELAATRARQAEHPLERQKFRYQAFSLLNGLLSSSKSESDRYARNTYLKLAIDELRFILGQENPDERGIEDVIRDVEEKLEGAIQKYPEDTFVNNSEADFARLIEDDERALSALETAFKINPRDPYITNRLSSLYKSKNDLEAAQICLKKALDGQPMNKELNFKYAEILRITNSADIETMVYYLGRSFSKGGKYYPAQFWYARYLFESSDPDKLKESKRLFKYLRSEAIKYETRMRVRDHIKNGLEVKIFLGKISSLQTEYGFITVDGRGDDLHFQKEEIDKHVWLVLKTESRVSFNIGFTYGGPIATNIKVITN